MGLLGNYVSRILMVFLIILFCSSSAWATSFRAAMKQYRKVSGAIKIGDDRDTTLAKLEKIQKKIARDFPERQMLSAKMDSGNQVDIYFMRTEDYPDGLSTDDEFTPYSFLDGKLVFVGWDVFGGPQTTYDPEKVRLYREAEYYRSMARAAAYQNLSNSLNGFSNQIQNTQTRNMQEQQLNEMRNVNMNLQQLNHTLRWK